MIPLRDAEDVSNGESESKPKPNLGSGKPAGRSERSGDPDLAELVPEEELDIVFDSSLSMKISAPNEMTIVI